MAALNRYPIWKYVFVLVVIFAAFIYASPNLYREYPAVQIRAINGGMIDKSVLDTAKKALQDAQVSYQATFFQDQTLLFRFNSTDEQFSANDGSMTFVATIGNPAAAASRRT